MLDNGKKAASGSARHAFRNFGLEATACAIVIIPARRIFNKSDVPGERIYDPIVGIALATLIVVGSILVLYRYFKRTDEHDLMAQLWALSLGCLAFALVKSVWPLLHDSSVLGPINEAAVLGISVTVGCVVWAWHKLR